MTTESRSPRLHLALKRALALVSRVVVRRPGLELGRAGVDGAVRALEPVRAVAVDRQGVQLAQEPRIDRGPASHLVDLGAAAKDLEQHVETVGRGRLEPGQQLLRLAGEVRLRVELSRAHRLRERLAERAADRHRLADGLHVGGQRPLGSRELLEREPRDLGDHVVDRGLERGRRDPGDVVVDLLERVAGGELRCDLRDREAGRLRGERRGARHPRVHLDDDDLARGGVDGELDVGAARLDPDRADHAQRLVAKLLVEAVREGLGGRDRHRVAGVHAHRVDVLDRADDDDVVVSVAHHLELELTPAEHRLLDQHLVDRARREALRDDPEQLGLGAPHAAPLAAQRERRPHDRRQLDLARRQAALDLRHRLDDHRPRHTQAGVLHRPPERLPVLGPVDRLVVGADQLDPEALQRAVVVKRLRQVERRLAAERRQQRVRALLLDDSRHRLRAQRLDVGAIGEFGIGHDRRRVGVHEHDLVAVLEQHLARLDPRVVELRGLPDHDGPRADQQDLRGCRRA